MLRYYDAQTTLHICVLSVVPAVSTAADGSKANLWLGAGHDDDLRSRRSISEAWPIFRVPLLGVPGSQEKTICTTRLTLSN